MKYNPFDCIIEEEKVQEKTPSLMQHHERRPLLKRNLKHISLLILLFNFVLLTSCMSPSEKITKEEYTLESTLKPHRGNILEDNIYADNNPIPNTYQDLCVPTYFTKVLDFYFIVDCYHDQVLYHENLTDPISDWEALPGTLSKPHTIASDGEVYLVDDTENHRVVVYRRMDDYFKMTQVFDEIGIRPHYIQYREEDQTFYVWSSMTGEMYLFTSDSQQVSLQEVRKIPQLDGVYVRSFTILEDEIYFVSGNSTILRARLSDFTILEEYPVPDSMAGMIQLTKIDSQFYITISTDNTGNQDYATIIRTSDLRTLQEGNYEDIYEFFIGGGTPYYITELEDSYYLTEHRIIGHSLWRFQVNNGEIENVEGIY